MNQDKYFERRMVVNKFSNRPPFDLKKPQESLNITENIKEYPEENCINCCKNRCTKQKPPVIPKSKKLSKTAPDKELADNTDNRLIISKIIENFQKATPSRELHRNSDIINKGSVETLYRKSTISKLGKNIPEHKLMKNLLKNFEADSERCLAQKKRNFGNRKGSKCKKIAVKKNGPFNSCSKINKKTSTTGLVWPPRSVEMMHFYDNKMSSNHNTIYEDMEEISSNNESSRPISEVGDIVLKRRKLTKQFKNNISDETVPKMSYKPGRIETLPKTNSKNNNDKKLKQNLSDRPEKNIRKTIPMKEKSFVQNQVEKLNKASIRKNKEKTTETERPKYCSQSAQKSQYLEVMNKVKNTIPQIKNVFQSDSEQVWSDPSFDEIAPQYITFPKETRMAIDQRLSEKRCPIPLSKFTKIDNVKPAVVLNAEETNYNDYCHCYDHGDGPAKTQNYPAERRNTTAKTTNKSKWKIPMPCKKNLLCDKGDHHNGPCGYTHNSFNKVVS
ncbi:uncharacterized protein LOC115884341 [Sitophilus oryzae]|uniref:Uncharacterized protein LOC115884341 n=1 Tax=Sitophilus oryzae TaxID=7048 RepID=A0A6J2Y6A5_SITOR|nr:uncharacterized protein LOC115884341 [Sitophilus oryzae]